MDWDALEPRKDSPVAELIGEDLSDLSVEELQERIHFLKAEIKRCEKSISSKQASMEAAENFFKT